MRLKKALHVAVSGCAVALCALLQDDNAHAANFVVTPLLVEAGEDLTLVATMNGEPGPDAIWVAGTERIMMIRINPDRRPGKNPGLCTTSRGFSFGTCDGWGLDIELSGPSSQGWSFPSPTFCNSTNALRVGDYIVSLDYQVSSGDGSSAIHTIDVYVTGGAREGRISGTTSGRPR